jgi:PAS domain S-box-containing protein
LRDADVHERIEALEAEVRALRASETVPHRALDDMTELVVRWQPDGTRTFVNEAYCRLFGTPREQLVGSSFWPLITEEDRQEVRERIRRLSPEAPVSSGRHRALRPDGGVVWMEWCDRALFDHDGKLVELQSVGRDISERMQVDEKLRQIEQADAIARTTAAIAHDLSGVLQIIDLLVETLDAGNLASSRQTLMTAAARGTELIRQLKSLAYGRIAEPIAVDLSRRVAEDLGLLRELAGGRVALEANLTQAGCVVRADPVQIDQILLNLVKNAAEAIGGMGTIRLSTALIDGAGLGESHRVGRPSAGWCLLRVADDGPGIDENVLPRIFDIHVTTKRTGRGIGLATVKAIVEAREGSIAVESSPAGSVFEVALPAVP